MNGKIQRELVELLELAKRKECAGISGDQRLFQGLSTGSGSDGEDF